MASLACCRLCNDPRTDLVDKKIKYYWCRTRVKGVKRVRNSSSLTEQVEGKDNVDNFGTSGGVAPNDIALKKLNNSLETGLDVEKKKTEAIFLVLLVRVYSLIITNWGSCLNCTLSLPKLRDWNVRRRKCLPWEKRWQT